MSILSLNVVITAQFDCNKGEHQFIFVYQNPPTENEDGYNKYRCYLCGEESLSILFATGRDWGAWVVLRAPTCTRLGLRRRTCMRHNFHSETEEIPALGCDFVLESGVYPTCTEDGVRTYTCTRCGDEKNEIIETALGCEFERTIVRQATCTTNGETTYVCARCGDTSRAGVTPAWGHAFGEWSVDNPAQEGIDGNEVRICETCGYREERILPALVVQPPIIEEVTPLVGVVDVAIFSFNFIFLLLGIVILFPGLQGILRLKKMGKKYTATKITLGGNTI